MMERSDKPSVLVVDDDDLVRTGLAAELKALGFRIQTAATEGECLDLVRQNSIDLVLLDIVMRDSNGVQTLKRIREVRPDLPVIMNTAFGSLETAMDALRAGASDYLLKPSQSVEIAHRIERVLQNERTRRMAESAEQFQDKLKSLQTLAGGLAHDLNNHLTVIISNSQQVLASLDPDQNAYAEMSDVLESATVIADLGAKLLSYAGAGHFELKSIDLCSVAPNLVQSIWNGLGKDVVGGSQIRVETEHQPVPVMVDINELHTVLERLIANAVESAVEDAPVQVTVKICRRTVDQDLLQEHPGLAALSPGVVACIRISDNGSGMDADTLDNVFDPFFSTKFTGRGLGLPSVLGILSGHGGGVLVQSTPDSGTTVEALIPVAELEDDIAAAPHTSVAGPRHDARSKAATAPMLGRIMIIDDETMVRRLTEKALIKTGHTVDAFSNGPDGLERFRQSPQDFDLVILDLCMPDMDGHEVLRELRKIDPKVKVLLTSGYHSSDVANRFEDERPNGFIPKPYPIDELRDKVTSVLQS